MAEYFIPATRFSQELQVSNSRFIATIGPVFTVEEAKDFIKEIRILYSDANHNVPVYLIGFGSSLIAHSSDDGEPAGTAGRPALSVLTGSGLGDTAIVITRYFGGTKLGTGGLVKAYGDSARLVIDSVPKAVKLRVHYGKLKCPYNLYERVKKNILEFQGVIHDQNFTEIAELQYSAPAKIFQILTSRIVEISSGNINPELVKKDQYRIEPHE